MPKPGLVIVGLDVVWVGDMSATDEEDDMGPIEGELPDEEMEGEGDQPSTMGADALRS